MTVCMCGHVMGMCVYVLQCTNGKWRGNENVITVVGISDVAQYLTGTYVHGNGCIFALMYIDRILLVLMMCPHELFLLLMSWQDSYSNVSPCCYGVNTVCSHFYTSILLLKNKLRNML